MLHLRQTLSFIKKRFYYLFISNFLLQGVENENIVKILRMQEQGQRSSSLKKTAVIDKFKTISDLQKIADPQLFVRNIPKTHFIKDAPLKKNEILFIIPRALESKSMEFKYEVLYSFLENWIERFGHKQLVIAFLEAGLDVNKSIADPDNGKVHLLRRGIDDYDFAQALLDYGADPNALSDLQLSPITINALHDTKNLALAKLLVAHGARLDLPENRGLLYEAIKSEFEPELMSFYISCGIDVKFKDEGRTVLDALVDRHLEYNDGERICGSATGVWYDWICQAYQVPARLIKRETIDSRNETRFAINSYILSKLQDDFAEKMLILLDNGATSDYEQSSIDEKRDAYQNAYTIADKYRAYQQEAQNLRNIDIN